MKNNKNAKLPSGFTKVIPNWKIEDEYDDKFINQLIPSLTKEGEELRNKGRDYQWIFAGVMTHGKSLQKLAVLGKGWRLPTPTDSTIGALNGIKFKGGNFVDNSERGWGKPNVSIRNRAAIVGMFGFGMTTDTNDTTKHYVYFVKK